MQKSGKAVSFSRTVSLPRPILLHRHNHAKLSLKKKAYRRGQAFEIEIKPFTGEKKKKKENKMEGGTVPACSVPTRPLTRLTCNTGA